MFLTELYYRVRLGVSQFIHPYNKTANKLLLKFLNHDIISIQNRNNYSDFYKIITFSNGWQFTYWDGNRYYAWLSYGTFRNHRGFLWQYEKGHVKASTMWKLKTTIEKYRDQGGQIQ